MATLHVNRLFLLPLYPLPFNLSPLSISLAYHHNCWRADLLEVLSNPEAMQFYPQPFDRQMTQTWIERNVQRYAQHGFGLWALILKQTGKLIGDCGLVVQEVDGIEEIDH